MSAISRSAARPLARFAVIGSSSTFRSSGTYVSVLPAILAALAFANITVNAFPLVLRDSDDAFGIATWVAAWGAQQGFTTDEADSWSRAVRSSTTNGFLFAVTYFVVSGVRG